MVRHCRSSVSSLQPGLPHLPIVRPSSKTCLHRLFLTHLTITTWGASLVNRWLWLGGGRVHLSQQRCCVKVERKLKYLCEHHRSAGFAEAPGYIAILAQFDG